MYAIHMEQWQVTVCAGMHQHGLVAQSGRFEPSFSSSLVSAGWVFNHAFGITMYERPETWSLSELLSAVPGDVAALYRSLRPRPRRPAQRVERATILYPKRRWVENNIACALIPLYKDLLHSHYYPPLLAVMAPVDLLISTLIYANILGMHKYIAQKFQF